MFIMLVIKCDHYFLETTNQHVSLFDDCGTVIAIVIQWGKVSHAGHLNSTSWKQRINMCHSVCQIGWDCYKHGNRHPKGFKCSSCV